MLRQQPHFLLATMLLGLGCSDDTGGDESPAGGTETSTTASNPDGGDGSDGPSEGGPQGTEGDGSDSDGKASDSGGPASDSGGPTSDSTDGSDSGGTKNIFAGAVDCDFPLTLEAPLHEAPGGGGETATVILCYDQATDACGVMVLEIGQVPSDECVTDPVAEDDAFIAVEFQMVFRPIGQEQDLRQQTHSFEWDVLSASAGTVEGSTLSDLPLGTAIQIETQHESGGSTFEAGFLFETPDPKDLALTHRSVTINAFDKQ